MVNNGRGYLWFMWNGSGSRNFFCFFPFESFSFFFSALNGESSVLFCEIFRLFSFLLFFVSVSGNDGCCRDIEPVISGLIVNPHRREREQSFFDFLFSSESIDDSAIFSANGVYSLFGLYVNPIPFFMVRINRPKPRVLKFWSGII